MQTTEFNSNGIGADFVYRHYDDDNNLLYVGVSNNVGRRLEQHKAHAEWASRISRTTIDKYDNREDALAAERSAIEAENPIHNAIYSFPNAGSPAPCAEMSAADFKAIRHRLRLTQAELSDILGYYGALAVSNYERATKPRPVPPLLVRLMRAYDAGYRPPDWPQNGPP